MEEEVDKFFTIWYREQAHQSVPALISMLKSHKNLPNSRAQLTIVATAAQYRHAFDKELEAAAKETKMEGFRPGKAPKAQVLQKVGRPRIEAAALDHAVSDAYYDALQEAKLVPVDSPNIELSAFTAPADDAADDAEVITFTAEVDVVPEVTIKGYEKIKVKEPKGEPVTEADIDQVLQELAQQRARLEEVADDTVLKIGMWADISFKGSVGGVQREDMVSQAHPVILGRGQLIPGFEEQLEGMKKGDEKTFKITFPKDYHASELAGKEAEFTVGVNEVKEMITPDLNDEFATSYGQKTLADLREMIKTNLETERQEQQKAKLEEAVLDELLKVAKFEVPASLVKQETDRVVQENKDRFERMQVGWQTYLEQVKKTEEDIREDIRPQSEKNVRIGLAMGKVIQEEGIEAKSNQAMREAMDRLIEIATK
jgi:trigger factor